MSASLPEPGPGWFSKYVAETSASASPVKVLCTSTRRAASAQPIRRGESGRSTGGRLRWRVAWEARTSPWANSNNCNLNFWETEDETMLGSYCSSFLKKKLILLHFYFFLQSLLFQPVLFLRFSLVKCSLKFRAFHEQIGKCFQKRKSLKFLPLFLVFIS